MKQLLFILYLIFILSSCYRLKPSRGGGEVKNTHSRQAHPSDVSIPGGLNLEILATGLTYPTGVVYDDADNIYVVESGYSYGEVWLEPKLLKINQDGSTQTILKGSVNGPWNGVDFYNGYFFISEGGTISGGKILKVSMSGKVDTLVSNLPSMGDHHTNGPLIHNGFVYFMVGTATNSGVVGEDNFKYGWLTRFEKFHDIPCKDVAVTGTLYSSFNPFTSDKNDKLYTSPFSPLGTKRNEGEVIKGEIPCSGAIFRISINGGKPELVCWGLRNPYGIAADTGGKMYVVENSYDDRGSRPVWGTGDVLWKVEENAWYGWPDYAAGLPLYSIEGFTPPGEKNICRVLQNDPSKVPAPSAILGVHSSSNGMDVIRDSIFGRPGDILIAQFGDMAPSVGKVWNPVGFKIVSVNPENGVIRNFASNNCRRNGPASWLKTRGLERPIDLCFNKSGNELAIIDFGILKVDKSGKSIPVPESGVIWKVRKRK